MGRYVLGIICAAIILIGYLIATRADDLRERITKLYFTCCPSDKMNQMDPYLPPEEEYAEKGYPSFGKTINGDWYPILVDEYGRVVSSPTLYDARAWGLYYGDKYEDPNQFRKIRVDEWGRVICSPSSVITVPGWTLEDKDSLDLGAGG